MTKITHIDRSTLGFIQKRVEAALKDLGDELGIDFSYAGGSYGAKSALKLDLNVRDTGTGKSSAQTMFERAASMLGLKPHWFGAPFMAQGRQFKITGYKPSARKNCIEIQDVISGRQYVCAPQFCIKGLEIEEAMGRIAA